MGCSDTGLLEVPKEAATASINPNFPPFSPGHPTVGVRDVFLHHRW